MCIKLVFIRCVDKERTLESIIENINKTSNRNQIMQNIGDLKNLFNKNRSKIDEQEEEEKSQIEKEEAERALMKMLQFYAPFSLRNLEKKKLANLIDLKMRCAFKKIFVNQNLAGNEDNKELMNLAITIGNKKQIEIFCFLLEKISQEEEEGTEKIEKDTIEMDKVNLVINGFSDDIKQIDPNSYLNISGMDEIEAEINQMIKDYNKQNEKQTQNQKKEYVKPQNHEEEKKQEQKAIKMVKKQLKLELKNNNDQIQINDGLTCNKRRAKMRASKNIENQKNKNNELQEQQQSQTDKADEEQAIKMVDMALKKEKKK